MQEANNNSKAIILIGDFVHEGITATISSLGYSLEKKTLYGRIVKTWRKHISHIKDLRESNKIAAIFAYFPTPTLLYTCSKEFLEVWDELLTELEKNKSIIFVFQDNLTGNFGLYNNSLGRTLTYEETLKKYEEIILDTGLEAEDYESLDFLLHENKELRNIKLSLDFMRDAESKTSEINVFIERLFASKIEIAPFRKRSEVAARLREFLEDEISKGIFLKLYVPKNRYQSEQFASFLKLFEDYFRWVEKKSFTIDTHKTEHGIVYIFKSLDGIVVNDIEIAIKRCEDFLKVCASNPNQAIKVLVSSKIDFTEASRIVTKYSKEYQRLILDSRQELEQRQLMLKHRLESEILEAENPKPSDFSSTLKIVQSLLPTPDQAAPTSLKISNITNYRIENYNSTKNQIINGDVHLNEQDNQILEMIDKHADPSEAPQLKSDLLILKDTSLSDQDKQTAKQRVTVFLLKTAKLLGQGVFDVGVGVLVAYIQKLLIL